MLLFALTGFALRRKGEMKVAAGDESPRRDWKIVHRQADR